MHEIRVQILMDPKDFPLGIALMIIKSIQDQNDQLFKSGQTEPSNDMHANILIPAMPNIFSSLVTYVEFERLKQTVSFPTEFGRLTSII